MSDKPRLCIDCKHHISPTTLLSVAEYSQCALTERKTLNLVTGEAKSDHKYCDLERSSGACGASGTLWLSKDDQYPLDLAPEATAHD